MQKMFLLSLFFFCQELESQIKKKRPLSLTQREEKQCNEISHSRTTREKKEDEEEEEEEGKEAKKRRRRRSKLEEDDDDDDAMIEERREKILPRCCGGV